MWQAEVITPMTGAGETNKDCFRPLICDRYPLSYWEDTTGQPAQNLPTEPNMFIVLIKCEAKVLEKIENDDEFCVLWSEEIIDQNEK